MAHLLMTLALAATMITCNSCSTNKVSSLGAYKFTEVEIRSKTWKDANDRVLQLSGTSTFHVDSHRELLLAKYSDTNTSTVTCLEFYLLTSQPAGRVPSLSKSQSDATQVVYEVIPERMTFDLLFHDSRPEMVVSVQSQQKGGETLFTVTRETVPGKSPERRGLRYLLVYDPTRGMYANARLEVWNIPPVQDHKPMKDNP